MRGKWSRIYYIYFTKVLLCQWAVLQSNFYIQMIGWDINELKR